MPRGIKKGTAMQHNTRGNVLSSLAELVLRDGKPNPGCTSYRWLNWQLRQDSPDVERPRVWTNRLSAWSQRPFHPPGGPQRPACREPVDHGFDPGRLIVVDLARTPAAAAAKQIGWDEVQVDDCFTGPNGVVSGSTLGPRWPELRLAGVVCLERGFVASLPAELRPPCPPPGVSGEPYELPGPVRHAPRPEISSVPW